MATNLRLNLKAERALRAEAARTGESQQNLIRTAVDQYLGLDKAPAAQSDGGSARRCRRRPTGAVAVP
jgi:hypothetical protein